MTFREWEWKNYEWERGREFQDIYHSSTSLVEFPWLIEYDEGGKTHLTPRYRSENACRPLAQMLYKSGTVTRIAIRPYRPESDSSYVFQVVEPVSWGTAARQAYEQDPSSAYRSW